MKGNVRRYRSVRTGRFYIGAYDLYTDWMVMRDELTGKSIRVAPRWPFHARFREV